MQRQVYLNYVERQGLRRTSDVATSCPEDHANSSFPSALQFSLPSLKTWWLEEEGCSKDLFLGGSCGRSKWREDAVIPELSRRNISFFNPWKEDWTPEYVPVEVAAKERAKVIFFVIHNSTRSASAINEAIEFICRRRKMVLVIQDIPDSLVIDGELISTKEQKDLNRARAYLWACAKEYSIPVYSKITEGLQKTLDLLADVRRLENFGIGHAHSHSPRRKRAVAQRVSMRCEQRRRRSTLKDGDLRRQSMPARCSSGARPRAATAGQSSRYSATEISWGPSLESNTDFGLLPVRVPGAPIVFLGGSCNPTTWRRDVAIPMLEKGDCPSYFNPQVDEWSSDLIEKERRAKETAQILLFVIDSQTRALVSMGEAIEYICRMVVLVVQDIPPARLIDGEAISEPSRNDFNRAREYLRDIARRNGVLHHSTIASAMQEVLDIYHVIADPARPTEEN